MYLYHIMVDFVKPGARDSGSAKPPAYRFAPCGFREPLSERTPPVFSAQDVSPPYKGTPETFVRIHFPVSGCQIRKAGSLPIKKFFRRRAKEKDKPFYET
jgi:hypothetical protein